MPGSRWLREAAFRQIPRKARIHTSNSMAETLVSAHCGPAFSVLLPVRLRRALRQNRPLMLPRQPYDQTRCYLTCPRLHCRLTPGNRVSSKFGLPTGLDDTRQMTTQGLLPEADATQPEPTHVAARTPAHLAAVANAHLKLAVGLAQNHGLLCHSLSLSPSRHTQRRHLCTGCVLKPRLN